MAKRKKSGSPAGSVKANSPKEKPKAISKSAMIVAGAILVAAVIVVVAILGVKNSQIQEQDRLFVQGQQATAEGVVKDIRSVLDNQSTGVARVYDADGNQLFTLRDTKGIAPVTSIPEELNTKLTETIVGGTTPKKIDLDAWSDSHKVFSGDDKELEDFAKGSLGWEAVSLWSDYTSTKLEGESKLVIAASVDSTFSSDELVKYILATSMFGEHRGVVTASEGLFGKSLSQLNTWQQDYLVYAFRNPTADWDGYKSLNPEGTGGAATATEFGFSSGGADWLLREYVQDELATIIKTDQLDKDYNVKLRINSRIQKDLQDAIDNTMASSVTLDSRGQPVLNGTAMVIDPATGYVLACVGGRSQTTIPTALSFPEQSNIGMYQAAAELMDTEEGLTYNSMVAYDTLSGQQELSTFAGLVHSGKLSLLGATPAVQGKITLDELASFVTGLYSNKGPRFIEQVQTSSGPNVFTAEPATDISQQSINPDLRCLLAGTTETEGFDYVQYANSGSAIATCSSEYIVAGLYGTTAQGYSLSDSDYAMCQGTAISVLETVSKHFPAVADPIDPNGVVAAKAVKAQESNAEYVTTMVGAWVEELEAMPITDANTGVEFENAFAYYMNMIGSYVGVVSDDLLDELGEKIIYVRDHRAEELLQFAS